jgi:hypothetical protein
MAATQLTKKTISYGTYTPGASPKYGGLDISTLDTPNVDGNYFVGDNRTYFLATLSSGSTVTVTVDCPHACSECGITTDVVFTVASGKTIAIGPFGADMLDSSGYVQITYSGITNLTVAAVRLVEDAR